MSTGDCHSLLSAIFCPLRVTVITLSQVARSRAALVGPVKVVVSLYFLSLSAPQIQLGVGPAAQSVLTAGASARSAGSVAEELMKLRANNDAALHNRQPRQNFFTVDT